MRKIKLDYSRGEFSEQDSLSVKLLERHPPFWQIIDDARAEIGISKPLKNFQVARTLKLAKQKAGEIIDVYNLPNSWLNSLELLIVMDRFPSPSGSIFVSGETRRYDPKRKQVGLPTDLQIIIKHKISFNELYNWMLQNKTIIQERLKRLPREGSNIKEKLGIRLKAFELYHEGKNLDEIYEVITKEYPRKWVNDLSPNQISKMISKLNRVLHRLRTY